MYVCVCVCVCVKGVGRRGEGITKSVCLSMLGVCVCW